MPKMTLVASNPPAPQVIAPGTDNAEIIDLWTHGKSKDTAALYRRVANLLLTTIDKPLQWLTLQDFQYLWVNSLPLGAHEARQSEWTLLSAAEPRSV